MADNNIGLLSRKSKDDMKITFEREGEAVSIFVARDDLRNLADRLACIICCSRKAGFGACVARCLLDGQCCDGGISNCTPV